LAFATYALYSFSGEWATLVSTRVDIASIYLDYPAYADLADGWEELIEIGAVSTGLDLGASVIGLTADSYDSSNDLYG
jgi:hypothetical protein